MMASGYNAKEEDGHLGVSGLGGSSLRGRKPENTAFKQQRLPAWQPVLTAGSVLPAFFIIGLIFIPIGIGLYVTSNNIREFEFQTLVEIDYTGVDMSSPCFNCAQNFSWNSTKPCTCTIPFYLHQAYENNVFMYYGLSNFYQNHRRYVKSRDDRQLNGDVSSLTSKDCEPYAFHEKKPIAPCGAIANSMFNDSLELFYLDPNGTRLVVPLSSSGIAWWTDKHVKFRNPGDGTNLSAAFQGTVKPINWRHPVYELDTDPENNGFINEDFIVWMRTAALPTFRKLYRVIQKNNDLVPTLPRGNYSLQVTYNFPVRSFEGRKRLILSTISWMGGKNPFLGVAYVTVGSACFVLGVVLLFIHHKYGNHGNGAHMAN